MPKTHVIGLISYYNSPLIMDMAIACAKNFCSQIWAFDGKYKQFMPNAEPESLPYIQAAVKNITQRHYDCPRGGWESQIEKRSFMLSEVPKGHYAFIFDSDELFFGRKDLWRRFLATNPKIGRMRYWKPDRYMGLRPRLLRIDGDIEYKGRHFHIYEDGKPITVFWTEGEVKHEISPVHFLHLHDFAETAYSFARTEFYVTREQQEWEKTDPLMDEYFDQITMGESTNERPRKNLSKIKR